MDWHKTYSANGNFCADLYFVELFGVRPNILTYTFNGDEDNIEDIDVDLGGEPSDEGEVGSGPEDSLLGGEDNPTEPSSAPQEIKYELK